MTNKKFKVAAMSMALTACVAAQPLAANAADDPGEAKDTTAKVSQDAEGENANGSNEGGENANANNGEATTGKDETGKETETPAGVNKQGENPEDLLGDKDVNYNHENPQTNPDGSTTVKGTVTDTTTGGTTGSGTETGSTGTNQGTTDTDQGTTDQGPTEIDSNEKPTEKDPSQIGTADKTEKDNNDTTTTTNPKEDAKPEVDPDKSSSSETKEDGTIIINTPTRVPATEETTSTGSGEANADLDKVEKPKQDFSEDQEQLKEELQKELGDTLPGWNTKDGDRFGEGEGDSQYHVVGDGVVSEDGNSKKLTLKKTTETPTDMTAADIAKLLEAEATTPDENGNYTLTRDKVEGVDKDGRKFTRITYITVEPGTGKVTTRTETTLVVTVEKGTQTDDKKFTEDEKDYTKSDEWSKETTIKDDKGKEYTVSLKDLLKDKTPEEIKSAMENKDSFTVAGEDGVTYKISFGEEDAGTPIGENDLKAILAAMPGSDYEYDKTTGKLYYIGEGSKNKTEVTPDKTNALLKSLSVTVKVTNKKGVTTETGSDIIGDKTAEAATAEAKLNAIKNALQIAAKKENLTLTDTDLANVSADETSWTYIDPKTGTTYTFRYALGNFTTVSVDIIESVSKEEKDQLDGDEINNVWKNTVSGTAYVSGATITSTGESQTYNSGDLGNLGSDFRTEPDGATKVKREGNSENGRIVSYVKDGKTYTFTYTPLKFENLDPKLQDELREKAKKNGLTLKEVTADLTKVDWTVFTEATEVKHEETIRDADPISVSPEPSWSQSDVKSNGKYDFTYKGGSAADMTLTDTSTNEDDVTTQTFTKTDEDGTVTTITVTTRKMLKSELIEKFNVKFGENNYTLNTTDHTVTYTNDGKTYTAQYDDIVQTMHVETKAPQEVAGTGNSEKDAIDNFMANLEKAREEAALVGEELILELPDGQKLTITEKTEWEEIRTHVKNVVNFKAMSDADLVNYLTKLRDDAVSSKTLYTGDYNHKTLYYFDEDGKSYHVSDTQKDQQGNITKVLVDGKWEDVKYEQVWVGGDWWGGHYENRATNVKNGPNYIGHLDLATDSKLKDEDGGLISDDCVLTEKTLEWNKNANDLVNNPSRNKKVGLLNRITYDDENDNDKSTGHYEYPRASWDGGSEDQNNAPDESAYYKVTGKVSYGKYLDAFEAGGSGSKYRTNKEAQQAAEKALDDYKKAHANDGLDLSKAKVVEIYKDQNEDGARYYQIYLYESNLTAYGYLSDSSNTCGNAHYNAQNRRKYVGGFDLTLGNLTQVSKEEIVAVGKKTFNCSATLTRIKKTLDQANKNLTYTDRKVEYTTTTGASTEKHDGMTGSYQATYTQEKYYDGNNAASATGTDSYLSYNYTNYKTTTGETTTTVTRKDGFVHFIYRTIKDAFVSKASKTETEKKSANVKYTYTTVETRDSYLPGDDQITIITPDDGDDDGDDEIIDEKDHDSPVLPGTPELPPVQDARPDAPVLPADPALPAVQGAHALPQTGVNWLAAIGLALSGMTLMITGAFASLLGKNAKH